MKILSTLIVLAYAFTATALQARPLSKQQVSSDAKWLLHLDLDGFRETKVGGFLSKEVLQKKLQKQANMLGSQFNLKSQIDLQKIRSITAYGFDYESKNNGVLLIHAGQDVQTILDGLVPADGDNKGAPAIPLKKLQESSTPMYSLNGELFASVHSQELLLLGKSKEQIEKAAQVLGGKAPNLTSNDAFAAFQNVPNTFFFLAIAEALNAKSIGGQAKVLQMAEGGRLVLGEHGEKLFLNLALRAKSAEVTTQIQQIVQGTIALAALSQTDNEDIAALAQSIKVSTKENVVSIGLEYPVAKAMEKLAAEVPKIKLDVSPDSKEAGKSESKEGEK
jgi:hypothetical protein